MSDRHESSAAGRRLPMALLLFGPLPLLVLFEWWVLR